MRLFCHKQHSAADCLSMKIGMGGRGYLHSLRLSVTDGNILVEKSKLLNNGPEWDSNQQPISNVL